MKTTEKENGEKQQKENVKKNNRKTQRTKQNYARTYVNKLLSGLLENMEDKWKDNRKMLSVLLLTVRMKEAMQKQVWGRFAYRQKQVSFMKVLFFQPIVSRYK
jgi:hypothetical protein